MRLSRWFGHVLPGHVRDNVDLFAQARPRGLMFLRGEWDLALSYAGQVSNIILRIIDDWGRYDPQKLSNVEYNHLRFVWRKDSYTIEDLAAACRAGGTKLWISGDVLVAGYDQALVESFAEFEYQRGKAILDRPGLEDVGVVVGGFGPGTIEPDTFTWFDRALALFDEYPGRVKLSVLEYADTWPWVWMGPNQGLEDINVDPFPDVTDRDWITPAWLFGRFIDCVPGWLWPHLLLGETGFDEMEEAIGGDARGHRQLRSYWSARWQTEIGEPYPGDTAALMRLLAWMDELAIEYGIWGMVFYTLSGAGQNNEWPDMLLTPEEIAALAAYIEDTGDEGEEPEEPEEPEKPEEPEEPEEPGPVVPSENLLGDLAALRGLIDDQSLKTVELSDSEVVVTLQHDPMTMLALLDGIIARVEQFDADLT